MKWMPEAEEAIKKVPFFVRKRVRARVENEAKEGGKQAVFLASRWHKRKWMEMVKRRKRQSQFFAFPS